jgi:hypothetical protein
LPDWDYSCAAAAEAPPLLNPAAALSFRTAAAFFFPMKLSLVLAALTLAPVLGHAALTGHWPFDEGNGTVAANAADPGFPGTFTAFADGSGWTTGPAGSPSALLLDGIDDIVTTSFAPVTGPAPRSLAAWIRYPAQSDSELDAIFSYGSNATGARWTVRIGSTAGTDVNRLRLEVSGGGIFGNTNLNDDQWHHIAVVQNGPTLGDVTLYVDGVAETPGFNGSGAGLAINSTADTAAQLAAIGGSPHATNYNFLGSIDDVRFYNHPLTAAEVNSLLSQPPSVISFTANPGNLAAPGQPATLAWKGRAQPGATWSITPAPGDVTSLTTSGEGAVTVNPAATTTYTLTVTDANGSASAQSTISVAAATLPLVINEVMAANDGYLDDENRDTPDWIELRNPNSFPVSAAGYRLRDSGSLWTIPDGTTVGAGGYLRIFASGKDRRDPTRNLHTDFSLRSDGEILELFAPGTSVATDRMPASIVFPDNVTWGRIANGSSTGYLASPTPGAANSAAGQPGPRIENVRSGLTDANGRERQPRRPLMESGTIAADSIDQFSGTQGLHGWTYGYSSATCLTYTPATFTPFPGGEGLGAWSAATQHWNPNNTQWGPSWERGLSTSPNTDLGRDYVLPSITGGTASPVRRWTSNFAGPAVLAGFVHGVVNSGDGSRFQIFLNGNPLLDSAPTTAGAQPFTVLGILRRFAVPVNLAAGDTIDFVCDAVSSEASGASRAWLRVWRNPETFSAPAHDSSLPITTSFTPTNGTVAGATLFYAIGFGTEQSLPMQPDGSNWTATIPLDGTSAGEMIRWRIRATDSAGGARTSPPYPSPTDSPRYHGTVATSSNPQAASRLGTLSLFIANQSASETSSGTRASIFWKGRFYDNIDINLHSSNAYAKRSWDIDFNRGHRFQFTENGAGHTDINLLTNWRDRSKLRNPQSYHMFRLADHPSLPCETVRLELNGVFHSTYDLTGELGEGALEEAGLDPEGALYKMQNVFNSSPSHATTSVEKRTRKWETGNADLANLLAGLVTLSNTDNDSDPTISNSPRFRFLNDQVDVAASINFIAAMFFSTSYDWGHKNYALYRDSDRSGRWMPFPWDLDLSWGHYYDGAAIANTYFDDVIRTNTNDGTMHNFSLNHNQMEAASPNRNSLFAYLLEDPTTKAMIQRRVRALAERFYLENGPAPEIEGRMHALTDLVDPPDIAESDADFDLRIWGYWNQHQTSAVSYVPRSAREETARILETFLPARRGLLFRNAPPLGAAYGGPLPPAQSPAPPITFGSFDANPASGNQDHEFIELINAGTEFVDLTGWKLTGGVTFTFPGGSVISPAGNTRYNGRLLIAKSATGWRTRTAAPTAGQGHFVLMAYDGQLSSNGDTVELRDLSGRVVATLTVPPAPSPAQQFLRVTEVHYHPADPTAAELAGDPFLTGGDFEFVELINTGASPLDVSGCSFTDGINWTAPAGTTIAAGQRIVLVSNAAAFARRHPGLVPDGSFSGSLSNAGERLTLRDAAGEQVVSFRYGTRPPWPQEPDGSGPSLVLIAPSLDPDLAENWRTSSVTHGHPAATDSVPFTGNPLDDSDADGIPALLEYALGLSDASPARPSSPSYDPNTGSVSLVHASAADAAALTIESSPDLVTWLTPGPLVRTGSVTLGNGLSLTTWSLLTDPAATPRLYLRARATLR